MTLMIFGLVNLFLGVVALGCLLYGVVLRNELARRWQRLRGLAADVRVVRQRRQGVSRDVARHLKHAQRHEQKVTRSGSQRGRRTGGKFFNVADNANGWPIAGTTGTTSQGMGLDVTSRDSETAAREILHREAEEYNSLVKSWPACIVAEVCGYTLWQYR